MRKVSAVAPEPLFRSEEEYLNRYTSQLQELIRSPKLGGFIIAMAHYYFDRTIFDRIGLDVLPLLEEAYQGFHAQIKGLLAEGKGTKGIREEDLVTFCKIALMGGLDQLAGTEYREVGPVRLQYNHLRSLKPKGEAAKKVKKVKPPCIKKLEDGFFNQPFLKSECFTEVELADERVSFFFNKYPYVNLHAILVPDREKKHNQYLLEKHHRWAWAAVQALDQIMPGSSIAFNSYGAFGTINHLHLHYAVWPDGYPVTRTPREEYPGDFEEICSEFEAWQWVKEKQEKNIAHNLLYTPGKMYGFARQFQSACKSSDWTTGFAWCELSGDIIVPNRDAMTDLTFDQIKEEFEKMRIR